MTQEMQMFYQLASLKMQKVDRHQVLGSKDHNSNVDNNDIADLNI